MFWRLVFQLLRGSRARLTVAILALVSGAAVISALLNLDFGVEHQLTEEFRTLGANIVIAPKAIEAEPASDATNSALMPEDGALSYLQQNPDSSASYAPYLYVVARAGTSRIVVVGTWLDRLQALDPTWKIEGTWISSRDDDSHCLLGRNAAKQLQLSIGDSLPLRYLALGAECKVSGIVNSGGPDDNQVFMSLRAVQTLAGLAGKMSVVQLSASGTPKSITDMVAQLRVALPQLQVRPIRQITEAEGALLGRIRMLIVSMVLLILILTAFCVLATMAALAMERRADVGLMKALGGSISRIVGLFVAEVGVLGAAGGFVGAVLGAALSYWMGLRVFGTAIAPRWEVLPITVILMTIVAMAGALPLRMLGEVKPAIILRGE